MPFALIALVVVPAVAGSLRVVELLGGPAVLPANPRLNSSPVPVLVHIVSALSYAVVGAFQFSTALRRRRLGWHRAAGRVLVVLGLAVAASALWMTLFFPRQPGTGELTYLARLAFASGLALCLVRGVTAVRRGDVLHHRAWMTRAYALALGAGTQVLTLSVGKAAFGADQSFVNDMFMVAAWVINLAVAELVIRKPRRPRRHPRTTAPSPVGASR